MIDLVKALRNRATWETATGITEPHQHIDWMAAEEITCLREENARLREAVKSAYYEGWQDNASIDDTEDRLHAEWEFSEAHAAIREGGKDE